MTQNHTNIIAEIGQAHDGSIGILHSLIDAIAYTGVDTIKFQMHIADAESSEHEPFRIDFSHVDRTRKDYWKRMELSFDQWEEVREHCEQCDVEFLVSPFSCAAVDLLEKLNVSRYKIGSGETQNYLMLEKIAKTGKPILLSSGMSTYKEISETLKFLDSYDAPVTVMQCTTQYPTSPEVVGLNVIGEIRSQFKVPVGFSDHSGDIYAGLAAVSLGANVLEVHATFDKRMFGPDTTSSLTITQLEQLVTGVRYLDIALSNPVEKDAMQAKGALRNMFEKSLAVSRDMKAGELVSLSDLEGKKPAGYGVPTKDYRTVIGKKLKTGKQQYDFLSNDDLQ